MYFPDIFTNVLSTAFWSRIKQRTLKILSAILEDKDIDVETEDRYFAGMIHPKRLTGKYNDEIRYDNSFEQNCVVLSKYTNQPVKTLTTKEYFTLIQYFNKENKR
jgi:hypothetical protein